MGHLLNIFRPHAPWSITTPCNGRSLFPLSCQKPSGLLVLRSARMIWAPLAGTLCFCNCGLFSSALFVQSSSVSETSEHFVSDTDSIGSGAPPNIWVVLSKKCPITLKFGQVATRNMLEKYLTVGLKAFKGLSRFYIRTVNGSPF